MVHRVKKLLGIPTVESTCISICMIEDNGIEDMCIGCGRTMAEITEFYNRLLSPNDKQTTLTHRVYLKAYEVSTNEVGYVYDNNGRGI